MSEVDLYIELDCEVTLRLETVSASFAGHPDDLRVSVDGLDSGARGLLTPEQARTLGAALLAWAEARV